MITQDSVRQNWQRKGIVGHCPICHRREWDEPLKVALPVNDGEPINVAALRCGHCATLIFVAPE